MLLREGSGQELVAVIQQASRALVLLSVPWSGPERVARRVFAAAVTRFADTLPAFGLQCFRLEVDEDEVAQQWLASVGLLRLAHSGSGSLLWLQAGRLLACERNGSVVTVEDLLYRATVLWQQPGER